MTQQGFRTIHCNGPLFKGNQNILFFRSIPGVQRDGAAPGETLGNTAADPPADPSSFDGVGGNYSKAMMQLEAFLKEDERLEHKSHLDASGRRTCYLILHSEKDPKPRSYRISTLKKRISELNNLLKQS